MRRWAMVAVVGWAVSLGWGAVPEARRAPDASFAIGDPNRGALLLFNTDYATLPDDPAWPRMAEEARSYLLQEGIDPARVVEVRDGDEAEMLDGARRLAAMGAKQPIVIFVGREAKNANGEAVLVGATAKAGQEAQGLMALRLYAYFAPGTAMIVNGAPGPSLWAKIPAGVARIGALEGDASAGSGESPAWYAKFEAFEVMRVEWTQGMWRAVRGAPSAELGWAESGCLGEECPATHIDWAEAAEACEQVGGTLLDEAQFEYANRAKAQIEDYTLYAWGDKAKDGCAYANVADVKLKAEHPAWVSEWKAHDPGWEKVNCADGYADAAPVAKFKPNVWGLYDMTGNVSEWTRSVYEIKYDDYVLYNSIDNVYLVKNAADILNTNVSRVVRGSSFSNGGRLLRPSNRYGYSPVFRYGHLGFRCARPASP